MSAPQMRSLTPRSIKTGPRSRPGRWKITAPGSATGSGDMPKQRGVREEALLVGAADPYEFIAEHAADAPYSSDVARVVGERPLSSSTAEKIEAGAGCSPCAPAFGDNG